MGILCCFRNPQLCQSSLTERFSHCHGQLFGRKCNMHVRHGRIILGHTNKIQIHSATAAFKASEARIHKSTGQFPRAVRTEIKENNTVIFLYCFCARAYSRDHKFIRQIFSGFVNCLIRFFYGCHRIFGLISLAVNHRRIRFFYTVPLCIAVHPVITAHQCCQPTNADFPHFFLQFFDKFNARGRRYITSIQHTMYIDFGQSFFLGKFQQRIQMLVMAVYTAIRQKAH